MDKKQFTVEICRDINLSCLIVLILTLITAAP